MAEQKQIERWVTIKGLRIPIFSGQSEDDVRKDVERRIAERNERHKEADIAKHQKEADELNGKMPPRPKNAKGVTYDLSTEKTINWLADELTRIQTNPHQKYPLDEQTIRMMGEVAIGHSSDAAKDSGVENAIDHFVSKLVSVYKRWGKIHKEDIDGFAEESLRKFSK